ncbi:hypothetical protein BKA66DRAFT_408330 [Pyrenochaeta sp. MPI-SDFR-AT-0127]|nr:hypothetical protein BKA66DRAFT_408330 [Pyrenochaeta sp. MPI-SDFR-AT-0127]
MAHPLPTAAAHKPQPLVRPAPYQALPPLAHRSASPLPAPSCLPSQSRLETLPVEIINQILSYLTHPRSRLPGLSEAQSAHDFPKQAKSDIKSKESLIKPPDSRRWAADLFSCHLLHHPFHTLSLTSRRCHELVESYCSHLVRSCNSTMFNLPFAALDKFGTKCVYPDMSGIVYRRLWLQHAPRKCIYCYAVLDCYPFPLLKRVLAACQDCFYRQALTIDEVECQYHISRTTVIASPYIRGDPGFFWVLRIDVEALALQLYGTRAFHTARLEQMGKPCSICAFTRFSPADSRVTKPKSTQKPLRRLASQRKKSSKRLAH